MNYRAFLTAGVAAFTLSCRPVDAAGLGDCRPMVSRFVDHSERDVVRSFDESDMRTKYRMYFCGQQAIHPPALYLSAELARGGEPVALFLRGTLAETNSGLTVRDIARVYRDMQRQGTYDVKADTGLMKLLTAKIASTRGDGWEEISQGFLREITSPQSQRYTSAGLLSDIARLALRGGS